jgi:hypothetical protein
MVSFEHRRLSEPAPCSKQTLAVRGFLNARGSHMLPDIGPDESLTD